MSSILPRFFSQFQNLNNLRFIVALLSLILSITAFLLDDAINRDGILYIDMANAFIDGGLQAAGELYDWPLFSILVALLSKVLFFLSTETSAQLLNVTFYVLLTDALVLLTYKSTQSLPLTVLGSLVILSFYTLNEYRDYIIRDVGYWALSAYGLYFLIHYLDTARYRFLLIWQLFAISAVFFRVEGVVILLAMPLVVLLTSGFPHKPKALMQAYGPFVLAASLLTALLFGTGTTVPYAKIFSVFNYTDPSFFLRPFASASELIAEQVMNPVARDQAPVLLSTGLVGLVLYDIVTGLSIGIIILALLARHHRGEVAINSRLVLLAFLSINVLILVSFSFSHHFISTRYCMMTIVTIVLLLLPKISAYIYHSLEHRRRGALFLIAVVFIFSLADSFHQTQSKAYIKQSAQWLSKVSQPGEKIFTNSRLLAFYLSQSSTPLNINNTRKTIQHCDYDALLILNQSRHPVLETRIADCNWQIVHQFGSDKKGVTVYRDLDHAD